MTEIETVVRMVWACTMRHVQPRMDALREPNSDRGELLPWVIITALLAAAAIAVVAIIVTKATTTAQNVKTQ